jgi:hypothetical protein
MEITLEERQAVQCVIDRTDNLGLDALRFKAYCDLEGLSHTLGSRMLTDEEIVRFQYSIELITRFDAKSEGGGSSFRAKRREKLTKYYSSYDRSKGARRYKG